MNTLSIEKNIIEEALSNMQNAINKKEAVDFTSNILFEIIEDKLVLKATDYETFIKTTLQLSQTQGNISCAVNGIIINNIMKSLNEGEIILEQDESLLLIKQNKSCFKIPIYDYNENFFRQNYQEMEKIDIDNNLFLQAIKKVLHCCAENKDITNIAMQGILLEIKNNLISFVATDSKRLGYIRKEYTQNTQDISCILPKKAITEILKLFNGEFEIYVKRSGENPNIIETLGIIQKDMEFYSKLINASYPDYQTIINRNAETKPTKITIDKATIIKAINQINAICTRTKITFDTNQIIFESINVDENSSASIYIDFNTNIEEKITIALTNKHILECISNSKYDEFDLYISNSNMPVLLVLQDFEEFIVQLIL